MTKDMHEKTPVCLQPPGDPIRVGGVVTQMLKLLLRHSAVISLVYRELVDVCGNHPHIESPASIARCSIKSPCEWELETAVMVEFG